jgi:hypothetical protein
MDTLALSPAWDLTLDGANNLAIISGPAQIAQDVASAIAVFLGELYWDTTQGIPWLTMLGESYNPPLLIALLEQTTLTVPNVISAQATINSFQNGNISGIVKVIDTTGAAQNVSF